MRSGRCCCTCRRTGGAQGSGSQAEKAGSSASRRTGTKRPRDIPDRGGSEIRQGKRRQGPDAHLCRSVQRQQGHEWQWRPEMDPEGRRLLQRVQQEAERLSVVRWQARADLVRACWSVATAPYKEDDCRVRVVDFTRGVWEKLAGK